MYSYKLKFTRLQNEVFRVLCIKVGKTLNQRALAKTLGVSPTAIAKSLKNMGKEGLIKIEKSKTMNLTSIQFNRDNPLAISFKRIENLKQILESGIMDFLEEKLTGCVIVLFGSYSTGEDKYDSDIDIAVIGSKEKEIELERFDKLFERKIYIHYYESINKIDRNLRQSIINGITLQGIIEI